MPIVVRKAEEAEVEEVAKVGEIFHCESIYGTLVPYDPESAIKVIQMCYDCDLLFVAYDDGELIGFLGAISLPFWLNNSLTIASEQFFWVLDKYRSKRVGYKLMKLYVETTEEYGIKATSVCVQHNNQDNMKGAIRLFQHFDYQPLEHTFMRISKE